MSRRRAILVAAIAATALLIAGIYLRPTENKAVKIEQKNLIGIWVKVSTEICSRHYPKQIEFLSGGIYKAPDGPNSGAIWHGGEWLLTDDNQLKIQASNDAMIGYSATFDGNNLAITDYQDCTVQYQQPDDK